MNDFWKKRVPAFFMTLVMLMTLSPAALAVTETNRPCECSNQVIDGSGWRSDGSQHWQICANCGGQVNLGVHTPDNKWYRKDDQQHEHRCSVCQRGLDPVDHAWLSPTRQEATCYQDGRVVTKCRDCDAEKTEIIPMTNQHVASNTWAVDGDYHYQPCMTSGCNYKQLNRQAHTFGGTYYTSSANPTKHWQQCTICGATSAMSDHYDNNGDRRCDLCGADTTIQCQVNFDTNGGTTIPSQSVVAGGRPTNPGTPMKNGCTFRGWSLTNNSVYNGQNLITSDQIANTTITASSTTYYAVYAVSATGRNITLDGGTSTSGTAIGSSLYNQLNTQLRNYISGLSVATVTFSSVSNSSYGTLYTSSNQRTSVVAATNYSDSEVSSFYFVPGSYTGYTVGYTAKDSSGYNSVAGTITINGSASNSALISYIAASGGSYSFRSADFQQVYRNQYSSGTIEYVEFYPNNDYTNFRGAIYSGSVALDRNTLTNNRFYYNASASRGYTLDSLSFRPDSDAANSSTLRIPFRAYQQNTNYYVDGTVELRVNGTTNNTTNTNRTIRYTQPPASSGSSIAFNEWDFYNIFIKEYPGYTFGYVIFNQPAATAFADGALYSSYQSRDQIAFTQNNLSTYRFYYGNNQGSLGNCALSSLSYITFNSFQKEVQLAFTIYDSTGSRTVPGTVIISPRSSNSTKGDLTYSVSANSFVKLKASDFSQFFRRELGSAYTLSYVQFDRPDTNAFTGGTLYYDYGGRNQISFTQSNLSGYDLYYNSTASGRYDLDDLTFVAGRNFNSNVSLTFQAYGTTGQRVSGTLLITVAGGTTTPSTVSKISYSVRPGGTVKLKPEDFQSAYRSVYSSGTISYVTFTAPVSYDVSGLLYYNFGGTNQVSFPRTALERSTSTFYYDNIQNGQYPLNDLTFAAYTTFNGTLTIPFRAHYSDTLYVDGNLEIKADTSTNTNVPVPGASISGDIRYTTAANTNVQINANDIARFFHKRYPNSTLQHITLNGVPTTGVLYYNYYGASNYGTTSRLAFSSANYNSQGLYFSPASTSQYALTELTYVPSGSNYCTSIPFTAYGVDSSSVNGTILISVNNSVVSDVYGVTNKTTAVTLPMNSISSVVNTASGAAPSSIQILELPTAASGTLCVGTGSDQANTKTFYALSSQTLRFVPSGTYTGSVEIPYIAYDANNSPIGSGKVCIGIVNSVKSFSDVTNTTWCYKYVIELSDADIIDGYSNGTFRPNNIITYGAALKLIMLAAGYPEQAPTTSGSPFSGYLAKAREDKIITRKNVNLQGSITRQQVAQLAAGSLKLNTQNLSSVQPFTDTEDVSVRALNAAGIVEGYFNNGTSEFRPGNTLTRGQVSAIVWRMRNYKN